MPYVSPGEESEDHLFVHCRWVFGLWQLPYSLLGFNWGQPCTMKDVLVWRRRLKSSWLLGLWKMIALAIWWSTWRERNHRIFDGKAKFYQDLKLYLLRTLYVLSQVLDIGTNWTFVNFVDKIILEKMRALGVFVSSHFAHA